MNNLDPMGCDSYERLYFAAAYLYIVQLASKPNIWELTLNTQENIKYLLHKGFYV